MSNINKKELSETDICDLYITPAIEKAGWVKVTQIRREFPITPGPVIVRGDLSVRNKKKRKFADYALSWEPGVPVAIVEAKDNNHTVSHGMQQTLGYAELLQLPSAFSSNGDAFTSHNKTAAKGGIFVYTYSLKQGIQDGFLAPYKVVLSYIDKNLYGTALAN